MKSRAWLVLLAATAIFLSGCQASIGQFHAETEQLKITWSSGSLDSESGSVQIQDFEMVASGGCLEHLMIETDDAQGDAVTLYALPGKLRRLRYRNWSMDLGEHAKNKKEVTLRIYAFDCDTDEKILLATLRLDEDGVSRILSNSASAAKTFRFGGTQRCPHVVALTPMDKGATLLHVYDLRDVKEDPLRNHYPLEVQGRELLTALVTIDGAPFTLLSQKGGKLVLPRQSTPRSKVEVVTFDRNLRQGIRIDISSWLR